MTAKEKFTQIFSVAPWLRTSKNIVHLPVMDPDSPKDAPAQLPGVTWAELYALIDGN